MMAKFKCNVCGYVYNPLVGDPSSGVSVDTPFEDLPADWKCPKCGANQQKFHKDEPACRT